MIATAPTASSLFGSLRGTVLEIGAGRGTNFSELHDATGYLEREALGIGWPHIAGAAFAD